MTIWNETGIDFDSFIVFANGNKYEFTHFCDGDGKRIPGSDMCIVSIVASVYRLVYVADYYDVGNEVIVNVEDLTQTR